MVLTKTAGRREGLATLTELFQTLLRAGYPPVQFLFVLFWVFLK